MIVPEAHVAEVDVPVLALGRPVGAAHVLGEDPPRLDPAHDLDAEVAVQRRGDVVRCHRGRDADGGALVPAPGVERAGDLALLVEDVAALLDPARDQHVLVDREEVIAVEARLSHLRQRPRGARFARDCHEAELYRVGGSARGVIRPRDLPAAPTARRRADWIVVDLRGREVGEASLCREELADRHLVLRPERDSPLAVVAREEREVPRLDGEARDVDGPVGRVPPAGRARAEDVEEAEALHLGGSRAPSRGSPSASAATRRRASRRTGSPCAAMIRAMSFFWPDRGAAAGVVVVHAPSGVAPDFWTPVFMYASLSFRT